MCGALVCAARVPVVLEGKRCRRLEARQNGRLAHTSTPVTPKAAGVQQLRAPQFPTTRPQRWPFKASVPKHHHLAALSSPSNPKGISPAPTQHHRPGTLPKQAPPPRKPPTPNTPAAPAAPHPHHVPTRKDLRLQPRRQAPPPHPLPPHPNLTPPPQSRPKKHNRRRHPQLPQLPLLPPIPHPLRRSPHPRLPRPPHRRRLLRLGLQARLRSDETPDRRGRPPLRRAQHRSHRVDLPRRARRRLRRNLPRRARARAHHERVGQGKGARV